MTIVRIGLAETKHFAEGYDAIFSRKKAKKAGAKRAAKTVARKQAKKKK